MSQAAIGRLFQLAIIRRFKFCRWHIADRLEQSPIVEPVDPFQRRVFDVVDIAPGSPLANELSFVKADDRFRQGVVVGY